MPFTSKNSKLASFLTVRRQQAGVANSLQAKRQSRAPIRHCKKLFRVSKKLRILQSFDKKASKTKLLKF
jgi:hypothetical protein